MPDKFTIILISFYSHNHIRYLLNKIYKDYKIIIIENSLSKKFKKEIENDYKNTKVIIPKKI